MVRLAWILVGCLATLSVGCGRAGDPAENAAGGDADAHLAERLMAAETTAKRLLAEVDALKASVPRDVMFRAELRARYQREVGEPLPPDVLERETAYVALTMRQVEDAAIRRAVEAGTKRPVTTPLAAPLVLLQVRSGAGGGNPNRIDMLGRLSPYVSTRSREPLEWNPIVAIKETSRAYVLGGEIPKGKAFAVTRVTWRAVAAGDSNGPGGYVLHLGKATISEDRDKSATYNGTWNGHTLIRRGEESQVFVEVANSSAIEARFEGEFVDDET